MGYRMFLGALGALCVAFWCWLAFGDLTFMTTPLARDSGHLPAMLMFAGTCIFGFGFTGFGLFLWRIADTQTWIVAYVCGLIGVLVLGFLNFGAPMAARDWLGAGAVLLSLSWASYLFLRAVAPQYFGKRSSRPTISTLVR